MVDRPSDYLWSSYPAFTGGKKPPDGLETNWLLSQFGKKRKDAEKNYKHFVEDAEVEVIGNPSDNIVGGFILGAPEFVNWVKDTFLNHMAKQKAKSKNTDRLVSKIRRIVLNNY